MIFVGEDMCITLESDYAVRIIGVLAADGGRLDAKTLSEQTGVTLRFSLKILRKLVSAGIVRSYKGMQGGYELAKDPSQITLYDAVCAIEGEYHINRCHEDDFICTRTEKKLCRYRPVFEEVSRTIADRLSACTFADMKE